MEIPSLDNLFTLLMLILLQAVLGFDNLLYISLESKRVEVSRQATLPQMGNRPGCCAQDCPSFRDTQGRRIISGVIVCAIIWQDFFG